MFNFILMEGKNIKETFVAVFVALIRGLFSYFYT